MALVLISCAVLGAITALVHADFFICKLEADFLNYYLMAERVAATGHPVLSYAVNWRPLVYASGASYLYAPAMMLFHSYAFRLRAIQCENLLFFGCYLTFAFRYIRTVFPMREGQVMTILFAIVAIIDWRTLILVMLPNADILPALVTVASLIVASSPRFGDRQKLLIVMLLCAPVFFIKMSVIVLPVAYSLVLLVKGDRDVRFFSLSAPLVVAILFYLYRNTMRDYVAMAVTGYLFPQGQVSLSKLFSVLGNAAANLLFVSLPESIIPNFNYFFLNVRSGLTPFVLDALNARDLIVIALGGAVSVAITVGAVRLWKTQSFALFAFALSLPVFALVTDGTARYLVSFEPLLWCCFMAAAVPSVERVRWNKIAGLGGAFAAVAMFVLIQGQYFVRRSERLGLSGEVTDVLHYFGDISAVYGGVRSYLDGLPRDRSLVVLVNQAGYMSTVWDAVSGIPSYDVSKAEPGWDAGKRVFLVLACRAPWCIQMPAWKDAARAHLGGPCAEFEPRARWSTATASAEVLQYRHRQSCAGAL